jgi:hypothetical protein
MVYSKLIPQIARFGQQRRERAAQCYYARPQSEQAAPPPSARVSTFLRRYLKQRGQLIRR